MLDHFGLGCQHEPCRTSLQRFQGNDPLGCDSRAVVFNHGEAQKDQILEVDAEQELLVPHGVEGVAVDGLGAEVAAVQGHPQHVDLDAGAARAVAGANVLARHDLQQREEHRGLLVG